MNLEQIDLALQEVDELVELTSSAEYKTYIYNHLNPVKYELKRIRSFVANGENPPPAAPEFTYRIEHLTTSGWNVMDNKDTKMAKSAASDKLNYYISEGVNPDALRVVVDL